MGASANAKANTKAEKRNRAKEQKKTGSPEKLLKSFTQDAQFVNDMTRWAGNLKKFVLFVFQLILIVGVCYVIIGPVLGIISSSFFLQFGLL